MNSVSHLNYWDRLKYLNLYSLERRRERYVIIYTYKILNNIVPNLQCNKFAIKTNDSERRGRQCVVPPINTRSTAKIKSLVEASFPVRAAKLFNCLSAELRNFCGSVEAFKVQLDKFLTLVPDKPQIDGYHQRSQSNGIAYQVELLNRDGLYY